MSKKENPQFAVFGLGRFGGSLVTELSNHGVEVLAVDNDLEKVEEYAQIATHALQANTIEEHVLKSIGIRNFDYVIVSFGDNLQESILTTLLLKEMGVKKVWVKAQNDYHHRVLEKIGADRIIHPERDMAKRIAHHIVSDKILDFIELSNEFSIAEIRATTKVANHTLTELDTRAKFGCNIVAIKNPQQIIVSPSADQQIQEDDILVVIGHNKDIERFEKLGV
ncbi:TrkA family potassium uptake protein [Pullulanibacillus sp. KACC 23026]|uniref:potassium channel family protein n=1 Tax=Pullulanibacillus sp. KACC 23026 TaxID=3028315 RepID=UPI0023AFF31D|nr:TrkA family potassium uptake protein [Pullulanibacillus sp. KACC 23026]WEG12078.1 TrkA family potassium uptake protein [Pullulanibacillus sp. KACC 23026]